MKTQKQNAFTLIEILIVVVIMAVLAAAIIPQFTDSTDDAKESTAVSPWKPCMPDTALMNLHRFVCVANWDFP